MSNFPDSAMDTLYARTAHFVDVTADNFLVNKVQADWCDIGLLTAMLVRGAQMETHAGTFRGVKINDDGIKAYDSSGFNTTPTFQVDAVTGAVTSRGGSFIDGSFTGTMTAGFSGGKRVVLSGGAAFLYESSGAFVGTVEGNSARISLRGSGTAMIDVWSLSVDVRAPNGFAVFGDSIVDPSMTSSKMKAPGFQFNGNTVPVAPSGRVPNTYIALDGSILQTNASLGAADSGGAGYRVVRVPN